MGVDFAAKGLLVRVRVLGRGMAQAAESMRAIGLEPGTSEDDLARRFPERSAAPVPVPGPMLEQMLRLHVRDAVRDGYRWSPAGWRSVRGGDGLVAPYRVRRSAGRD